uniref:Uncharacterized protein n=1 Tax=Chenopodium quinoa TaxID=63459 RepID=A0A803MFL3_CHEQI
METEDYNISTNTAAVGPSTPDLTAAYASRRFFISSPGRSNSIVDSLSLSSSTLFSSPVGEEAEESSSSSPAARVAGGVPVHTYSPNPYVDFRRSMQEMVESRDLEKGTSGKSKDQGQRNIISSEIHGKNLGGSHFEALNEQVNEESSMEDIARAKNKEVIDITKDSTIAYENIENNPLMEIVSLGNISQNPLDKFQKDISFNFGKDKLSQNKISSIDKNKNKKDFKNSYKQKDSQTAPLVPVTNLEANRQATQKNPTPGKENQQPLVDIPIKQNTEEVIQEVALEVVNNAESESTSNASPSVEYTENWSLSHANTIPKCTLVVNLGLSSSSAALVLRLDRKGQEEKMKIELQTTTEYKLTARLHTAQAMNEV